MNEHYHFYYIKDLLGNIRETYVHPEAGYKECIQRMQYYPSGLPWAEAMEGHPKGKGFDGFVCQGPLYRWQSKIVASPSHLRPFSFTTIISLYPSPSSLWTG